jgi:signal transduction histidine kinase
MPGRCLSGAAIQRLFRKNSKRSVPSPRIGIAASSFAAFQSILLRVMPEDRAAQQGLIETLAAGVAHEVRNPLNSLQINVGILEQELSETLLDRGAHAFVVLQKIAAEIKRLDDFVSEFLRFARPPRLNVDRVAIRPLLSDLAEFMAPECSKKGVSLRLEVRGPERAWLDGFQLKQSMLNLVLNALQATPAGGHIVARTSGDDTCLAVAVSDDGEGMAPETREKCFTPFFTTREGGTGLGLPLVRRIVEEHGGSVEVASAAGQGTTVSMLFPQRGRPGG